MLAAFISINLEQKLMVDHLLERGTYTDGNI